MKYLSEKLHAIVVLIGGVVLAGILMAIPILVTCAFFLEWKRLSGPLLLLAVLEFFILMASIVHIIVDSEF